MQALDTDLLLRRYANGLQLRQIAIAHNTSTPTICRRLRSARPGYVRELRRFSPKRRQAFITYCQKRSLVQTAKAIGCTRRTLKLWFRAMHPDYAAIARRGVFCATADYLLSNKAKHRPGDAQAAIAWLTDNLPTLLEEEGNSPLVSFPERRERTLAAKDSTNVFHEGYSHVA